MNDDNERPVPKQYDWAVKVYEAMLADAAPQAMNGEDDLETDPTASTVMVYEGHLTQLFARLECPNPYYTSIMKALKTANCVEQLRRGGGAAKSQWVLHRRPTEGDFIEQRALRGPNSTKIGQLEQQVRDLRSMVRHQGERIDLLETKVA